jgi:hypothetical protein
MAAPLARRSLGEGGEGDVNPFAAGAKKTQQITDGGRPSATLTGPPSS